MVKTNNNYDPYTRYYLNQVGNGVGSVYQGVSYQKGHGIGKFLGGLFRSVLPLLKSGARTVGHEALRTGMNVIGDLASNDAQPVKRVIRKRVLEAGENLMRRAESKIQRMTGGGYIQKTRKRKSQSKTTTRGSKTSTSKKKRKIKGKKTTTVLSRKISKQDLKDIFT